MGLASEFGVPNARVGHVEFVLLFGVVPFFIASSLASERVEGQLPLQWGVITRYRRLTAIGWTGLAVGLVLDAVGLLSGMGLVLVVMGLAAIVVGIGAHIWAMFALPNGRPDDTGDWVGLTHVDRRFADEVHSRYGIRV